MNSNGGRGPMRMVFFCHSLVSDWNHGNAHFLRGVLTDLRERGHDVRVFEPAEGWSLTNLVTDYGLRPLREFGEAYPGLSSRYYRMDRLDLDAMLDGADLVVVHEWNDHDLVRRIGEHRAKHRGYRLLFHDTHHRSVTDPGLMAAYDLEHYDGVLAFGEVIRELYLERGWAQRAWTWHEAADTRRFRPLRDVEREADLVWVGNWGDDERTAELHEFLLDPVADLGLSANVHGVRYPREARQALAQRGIHYRQWLANFHVPAVFARHRVTVHVPRRPYVESLPGIPTIRPFEAMACGIPLICSPWDDAEGLFNAGTDYLVAKDGKAMRRHLRAVLNDDALARDLAAHGRHTVQARHTCAHRVDELLGVLDELTPPVRKARKDLARPTTNGTAARVATERPAAASERPVAAS